MNINSIVINALASIGLPVVQDIYEGTSDKWIVFNYAFEDAEIMADDKVLAEHTEIQVHLFVPKTFNYFTTKDSVMLKLYEAGFSISSKKTLYEAETKRRHILFECSILG